MSKELEALKEARKFRHEKEENLVLIDIDYFNRCLDGIETELKRLKELEDNFNNLNEFYFNLWYLTEALKSKKYAKNLAIEFADDKFCLINSKTGTIYEIVDDVKGLKVGYKAHQKQEKSLKALEIIKEKRVNVDWLLETENVEEYNESLYCSLTQEEYDLLKEVLI